MISVMRMNLFAHLVENYNAQWGFDPGFMLIYLPTITPNSSPEEFYAWNIWWARDGHVLYLLTSCLSLSAPAQFLNAGNSQPQCHTAYSVYKELLCIFSGTDFHTATVTWDELSVRCCAPSSILHCTLAVWTQKINICWTSIEPHRFSP